MRIFITGASGYIGAAVAAEMARYGHDVTALARSQARGQRGALHEVRPVIGAIQDAGNWIDAARDAQVLIHCAAEYSARMAEVDGQAIEALLGAATQAARPRLLVYTSGCWMYGNTGSAAVDESSALRPFPMVAWRVKHEETVLNAALEPADHRHPAGMRLRWPRRSDGSVV